MPDNNYQASITPHLPKIVDALKSAESKFLVLTAETAAGKSTVVPPALLNAFAGKILMLEPRRLATIAVASRVAELLGEKCGETSGYRLHMDSCVSEKTRFEVMTEAILVRMMQEDASLEGVSCVILDEFHERSIWTDLSLAFLKDAVLLRDDLFVLIMSATIDTERLTSFLGCEHIHVPGRQYPVEISYRPVPAGKNICEAVADTVESIPKSDRGSVLAFLPGLRELRRTEELLAPFAEKTGEELFVLHSTVPVQEQRKILTPAQDGTRRIILPSAVAETSVTVPGITYVIDSGLSRISRLNTATGMNHLVTEPESVFSAEQRAGRAGRTAKGNCIRLWSESDVRVRNAPVQIMCTELVQLVLECALWGVHSREGLSWLDAPPVSAWNAAADFLRLTGCVDDGGFITAKGKLVLKMGVHPRIACIALESLCGNGEAIQYAAKYGVSTAKGTPDAVLRKERARLESELARRLRTSAGGSRSYGGTIDARVSGSASLGKFEARSSGGSRAPGVSDTRDAALSGAPTLALPGVLCLLAGFLDRAAHLLGDGVYMLPSGRQASLSDADKTRLSPNFPQWIIAVDADAGEREGRIYSFESVPELLMNEFDSWLDARTKTRVSVAFVDKQHTKLKKTETVFFGKIPLKTRVLPASAEDSTAAWCTLAAEEGIRALPWDEACSRFVARADFYMRHSTGEGGRTAENASHTPNATERTAPPTPETTGSALEDAELAPEAINTSAPTQNLEETLALSAAEWLTPFISAGTKLNPETVLSALRWKLDGDAVDKNVPERLTLPNGKKCKVVYETTDSRKGALPVIEIIIQQMFGCFTTPKIMGEPVLMKLLSPARRPLQVTSDLENFWENTWPEICKEMKGRYPKHNWDYTKPADTE